MKIRLLIVLSLLVSGAAWAGDDGWVHPDCIDEHGNYDCDPVYWQPVEPSHVTWINPPELEKRLQEIERRLDLLEVKENVDTDGSCDTFKDNLPEKPNRYFCAVLDVGGKYSLHWWVNGKWVEDTQ